jgi:hypothetical protein
MEEESFVTFGPDINNAKRFLRGGTLPGANLIKPLRAIIY